MHSHGSERGGQQNAYGREEQDHWKIAPQRLPRKLERGFKHQRREQCVEDQLPRERQARRIRHEGEGDAGQN